MARPSEFSPAVANELCERIADGESLRSVCADDHMPSKEAVRQWLARGEAGQEPFAAFLAQYARAREEQGHTDADNVGDVARKVEQGLIPPDVARVMLDAYKWSAAKRAPKKYGDKVALTGGDEGDAPVKNELTVRFVGD